MGEKKGTRNEAERKKEIRIVDRILCGRIK